MQEPERYAGQVIETVAEVWGSMLFRGATSFWETDVYKRQIVYHAPRNKINLLRLAAPVSGGGCMRFTKFGDYGMVYIF